MFLLINKPNKITSHDVIAKLRQITGIKKIGHAGTLDPFATGLLVVALSRQSTKELNHLIKLDKTYEATLELGATSDTYDKTGKIKITKKKYTPTLKQIQNILKTFTGQQKQTPPSFSAKKINGQKAYNLARQGKPTNLKPQSILIHNIQLNKYTPNTNQLEITVSCSSGTYIRSLANDIGKQLKCGAYLKKLKRTSIGPFNLKNAIDLNKITKANWKKYTLQRLPPLPQKTKVITFGTFDLLHKGHINFLKSAKQFADELYIIIARDKNVKHIKGKLPTDNEQTRLKNLKELSLTHHVYLGQLNLDYQYRILNRIKPDVIALGYDQKINQKKLQEKLEKYGISPKITKLNAHMPHKFKTSIIKSTH